MPGKEGIQHLIVVEDVAVERSEPLFSLLGIGGLKSHYTKGIYIAHLIVVYGPVYLLPYVGIGTDDVGYLQTCRIEGFARRAAHDAAFVHYARQRTERRIAMPGTDDFAVNLV